ncbi:MAG TPA: hypothetical protein VIH90_07985 [Candidatus Saccharimonadales bacterium]
MIDQIISARAECNPEPLHPSYTPRDVVEGISLINTDSDTLTAVFPPWHSVELFDRALDEKLASRGSAVLRFKLHNQLLEPDVQGVLDSFMHFQKIAESAGFWTTDTSSIIRMTFSLNTLA